MKTIFRLVAFLLIGLGAVTCGFAQSFPDKPVKVIVGFPPGSVPDIFARMLQPGLQEAWKQPLVVENRPGASGAIAAGVVARAPKDGHTLLVHGAYAVNAAFSQNLSYDPLNDLVDIAPIAWQPFVLVTAAPAGARTLAELIAAAKTTSSQLNYGSPGVGSYPHLGGEKLKIAAGIEAVHVPFKGPGDVIVEIIAGRIDFAYSPVLIALPYIREGKLNALAVSSEARSRLMPDVPTTAEAGLSGSGFVLTVGLWAPAGTPASEVEKISNDVALVLATPAARSSLTRLGAEPMTMRPAEFAQFVRREIEDLKRTVKAAGLTPQ